MPRTRPNPLKGVMTPFKPAPTTVVVLTCVPYSEGYYEHRFDVTKLCLATLLAHTDAPYDLMVFDNGSRPDVVEYLKGLKDKGLIKYLLLSQKNIGYGAALNMAFGAAPGEYIAYSDDDVFFYPGWLSRHLEVLNTFPKAGLVSGQAVEGDFIHDAAPKVAAEQGIKIEEFKIPREWTERWCRGLGLDPDEYVSRPAVQALKNFVLEYKGVRAYAGATGYSFIFRRSMLKEMPPFWSDRVIGGEDAEWHRVVNARGYLRLATSDLLTDHIGNVLDDRWVAEARKYKIDSDGLHAARGAQATHRRTPLLLRHRFGRRAVKWLAAKLVNWM